MSRATRKDTGADYELPELDAMHPATLRRRVEAAGRVEIEPEAWGRCETAQAPEQQALTGLLDAWAGA